MFGFWTSCHNLERPFPIRVSLSAFYHVKKKFNVQVLTVGLCHLLSPLSYFLLIIRVLGGSIRTFREVLQDPDLDSESCDLTVASLRSLNKSI